MVFEIIHSKDSSFLHPDFPTFMAVRSGNIQWKIAQDGCQPMHRSWQTTTPGHAVLLRRTLVFQVDLLEKDGWGTAEIKIGESQIQPVTHGESMCFYVCM